MKGIIVGESGSTTSAAVDNFQQSTIPVETPPPHFCAIVIRLLALHILAIGVSLFKIFIKILNILIQQFNIIIKYIFFHLNFIIKISHSKTFINTQFINCILYLLLNPSVEYLNNGQWR